MRQMTQTPSPGEDESIAAAHVGYWASVLTAPMILETVLASI